MRYQAEGPDEYAVFFGLMHSLDQAYLSRQGLCGQETEAWGRRFFAAFDALYPSWADQEQEIYLAAGKMLYTFAHGQRHPFICSALLQKPESLVRMVVLLLKNNLIHSES